MKACSNCGRPVEEGPLYRQNPKGEKGIFWCEPCITENDREVKRDPIIDANDRDNQTVH